MKTSLRRLTALILALSMTLSLLSVNVWAADTSADVSGDVSTVQNEGDGSTPEEAPDQSNKEPPKEAPDEAPDQSNEEAPEEPQTPSEEVKTKVGKSVKAAKSLSAAQSALRTQGDPVTYLQASWDSAKKEVKLEEKSTSTYTTVDSSTTSFADNTWYVVNNDVTISSRITVSGTVNLILCDGANLTASRGITVTDSNTLNIYAQSEGDSAGELISNGDEYCAGIGGDGKYPSTNYDAGTVTIHGGKITVTGDSGGAGIGGSNMGNGGTVTIYGGTIEAAGKLGGAGIGGGKPYNSTGGNGGEVTIYGGKVKATATGYSGGAGIGGGYQGAGGIVTINGGTIEATGSENGAGIGGGKEGNGGTVIINGGTVTATGGSDNSSGRGGAGIGSGSEGTGGTVDINGGMVTASGGYNSMGIGGVCGWQDDPESGGRKAAPPKNGSLTIGSGLKVYGGNSANPTTEITQDKLSEIYIDSYDKTDVYQYMIVSVPPHTHSFTYSASGATITASCGNTDGNCTLPPSTENGSDHVAKLTIGAPLHTTYGDGKDATAVITDANSIQGTAKVQYQKKKTGDSSYDTATETAPTDPGTYKASITLGESDKAATASVVYDIFDGVPEKVYYREYDYSDGKLTYTDNEIAGTGVTEVTNSTTEWANGTYVVPATTTISSRITVTGTVNLILCDGANLTASRGITVTDSNTLNIYAQSEGDSAGVLISNGDGYYAGIGGIRKSANNNQSSNGGFVSIHGGKITATGGTDAAGIGGGNVANGGTVTIYGGAVTATGNGAAGIGGGSRFEGNGGNGGKVTIYGGKVTATGGYNSAGIGAGTDGDGNNGNAGEVIINGGTVTATGGYNSAGIGGGAVGAGGTVTINGGTVTATGNGLGAGIGGGISSAGGTVTINGGTVTATGGDNESMGIGGVCGYEFDNDSNVIATPPKNGSLTVGSGLKVYGGGSANPTTEITQDKLSVIYNESYNETVVYQYMIVSAPPHTHSFTYSAEGATITATCTATATDCPLPASSAGANDHVATLTINAPEHKTTGDGKSAVATLTDLNSIHDDATVSYYKANADGTAKDGAALAAAPTAGGKYWAEITLTNGGSNANDSATAHVVYDISDPEYTITLPTGLVGGTVTADKVKAKFNEVVTLTAAPADDDHVLRTLTVKDEGGKDVTVTDNQFTMPASPVTVSASFEQKTRAAVALTVNTVSGKGGTACLMDEDFAPLSENEQVREGEEFILCVDPEEEYNFTLALAPDAEKEEFSADDYKDYLEYVDEHNENAAPNEQITISPDTVMYWVTMPRVTSGNLSATVTFIAPKTYTVLYQPTASTEAVFCKLSTAQDGTNVKYGLMNKGAKMGDNTVWSMTVTSANEPKQIAFAEANQPKDDAETAALMTALQGAAMTDISGIRTSENWTTLANNGKYCVFGGNAKVVTAIFVSDANAAATDEEYSLDNAEVTGVEAYQFAVCPTDSSGKVTDFASVTAPAAPAAPTGKAFAGWRGFQFDSIDAKATDHDYSAGATIKVRENTVFNAAWKPQTLKVKRNLNGGTGESGDISVQYQEKASISEPTRSGYVFDGWTVSEAVTEDGVYYAKGSVFDTETRITANLKLTAQWKHVHYYSCYQISAFGTALSKYLDYEPYLHVAVCGCNDVQLMAHEFNSAGKCECGCVKPGAQPVTLHTSYVKMSGGTVTATIDGGSEEAAKNQEVEICAPGYWGESEFSKWEYSTNNTTWYDLTADAYASFLIPATMYVRAVYTNPVAVPTVELISRKYDDHAVVNGTTYTMDNILYQMNYKLPDGCTFVDGGIKLGDNSGISYYFIQQVRMSYDNESKGIIAGLGAGLAAATVFTDGIFAAAQTFNDVAGHMNDTGITYNYLETEKDVTSEKMDKATLAKYMYEGKPVNVEKYPPIYWVANVPTKGMSGSIATAPPLRFAQKNNQEHYIYGIAWMRYKDSSGKTKTIYTDAITPTAKNPAASISKSGS